MTDNDIKSVCEKIESLHEKILKSKFAETVTESEMLSLILAVRGLKNQKAVIDDACVFLEEQRKCSHQEHEKQMEMLKKIEEQIPLAIARAREEAIEEFAKELTERFKQREQEKQCSWCKHSTVWGKRSNTCDMDNGNGRVRCFFYDRWESCVDNIIDNLVKEMTNNRF